MKIVIFTIGLEMGCRKELNRHFKQPLYRIEHRDVNARVFEQIQQSPPRIIVIGPLGQSFDDRLHLVRRIKTQYHQLPIILVNHESSEAHAVASLRAGVNDYFTMPLCFPSFIWALKELMTPADGPVGENQGISPRTDAAIVGQGQTMQQIKRYLLQVAGTNSTVLITGETGTGKDLIAQTIHKNSPRADYPMVCVNCAAIPENLVESELFGFHKGAFTGAAANQKGKFVLANRGTLFMDEISEMSLYAQAKILRCIENNEIFPLGASRSTPLNVRIIAATNRDPENLIEQGNFRRDLYYRLNVAHIHLPPLRERKEDIPELVARGIDHLNNDMGRSVRKVSNDALTALIQYAWPGNVRELNNVLESAFIQCESKCIEFCDFPKTFIKKINFNTADFSSEKDRLMLALADTYWNKSQAARKLKWSRMRIYRFMKRYNIVTPDPMPK
jgi:DNA-binding NtrC family response regulator